MLTPATAPSTAGSAAAISPEEMLRQALASADQFRSGLNAAVDSDALLRRVQAMIDRSEQRQQQKLALRLAQVVRLVPGDSTALGWTLVLRIKGRDLSALREGRLSKDEARKRVEVKQY